LNDLVIALVRKGLQWKSFLSRRAKRLEWKARPVGMRPKNYLSNADYNERKTSPQPLSKGRGAFNRCLKLKYACVEISGFYGKAC
jgi:hypothetical protein